MKKFLVVFLMSLMIFFIGVGQSLALSIDFNDVTNGEVLDSKYAPGLTLGSIANANNYLTTMPIDSGTNVVGRVSGGTSIGVSSDSYQGLLLSFDDYMSSVSIVGFDWGGSSTADNETMYLSAFDQNGTFLGGSSFGGAYADPNTRLGTLTYDNIAHVAFTFGNTTLGFYGIDSIDATEMTTAPVPEPATIFLMGIGVLGMVGIRRRQNKK